MLKRSVDAFTLVVLIAIGWERFAWCGMLGEVDLWPLGGSSAVGNLLFASYILPALGGWLSGYLGKRLLCVLGSLLMALGYASASAEYAGLAFGCIALGCGMFKPCLMALVSSHSTENNRAGAFSRFYSVIQLGALLSSPVAGLARRRWGFPAAFSVCAVGAAVACLVLIVGWSRLRETKNLEVNAVLDLGEDRPTNWWRLGGFLVGVTLFMTGLQQQQTTMIAWARDVCSSSLPEVVSTLNPLFCAVLLFIPIFAKWKDLRSRAGLAGLSLTAAYSLLILAGKSIGWLVGWYALATTGEALLAPVGMAYVCSCVPRRRAGLASALWLATLAIGGKMAGVLGSMPAHQAVTASVALSLLASFLMWVSLPRSSDDGDGDV